jgi:leucine dehydrogenase
MTIVQSPQSETARVNVFDHVAQMGHEQVVFCHDQKTGLRAIIAVHNTVLGPALGGTRMWAYATEAEAVHDVLRLSRGMTYKNAIAGLNLGGGKAVIIGESRKHKTEALLRLFGKFVENLNGKYITAEDMGMGERDMEILNVETSHVTGLPESQGGSGNPSGMTAYGTYMGMKAAAKKAWGTDNLAGKKVSVQGAGNVATFLVEHLLKENATVYVSDVYEDRLQALTQQHKVNVVGADEIYDLDVDIYAPCALGATVNDSTLNRLRCQIIAGCANNQLADERIHGEECVKRGIIYAPDFLVNSGGVINIATEVMGSYNRAWAIAKTEDIYQKTLEVLDIALSQSRNPQEVAMEIAAKRISDIAHIKTTY